VIRVTVELDKFGRGTEIETLGVIEIVNDGTGNSLSGRYDVRLGDMDEPTLATSVERHYRPDGWLELLALAADRLRVAQLLESAR
jgi:hypothetical protein